MGDESEQEKQGRHSDVATDAANPEMIARSVNIQRGAVVTLAALATIVFIDWAQPILLPLTVAILLSYSLDPMVSALHRIKIPRPLGAALVLMLILSIIGGAAVPLQQQAIAMLDKVPQAMSQFERSGGGSPATRDQEDDGVVEKAQEAVEQIEKSAEKEEARSVRQKSGVSKVQIVEPPLNIQRYVMSNSGGAIVVLTQFIAVTLLVYFILAVGNLYKRKVVRLSGPTFGPMRKAARIMTEFHHQVRRFLFVMLVGAIFVGSLTYIAFLLLGVEQAAFWGVVAGVASAIPYLGPFLVLIGSGMAGFLQSGTLEYAIVVAGTSMVITSIQGYILMPLMTARVSTLNPVAIFVGLLFWGWIWGAMGLIIAAPLLMIIKSLCNHVVNLRAVGELLGK